MKRLLYFITIMALIITSCEPMAEIYDEMEANDTGYSSSVEYTLTEDDYVAIADLTTNSDAASFIESKMYFTDDYPAADLIPAFLAQLYPALSEGSSVMVTYKYNNEIPDDLTDYTDLDGYTIAEDEYQSADDILQVVKYYSPGYSPEIYIPAVLAEGVADASPEDLLVVEYKYSDVTPEVDMEGDAYVPFWEEGFDADLGTFTQQSVTGDQLWVQASYGGDDYAKMSGYASGAQENEDWLVSGSMDLSGYDEVYLAFRHAANYVGGEWDLLSVMISTDYTDDVTTATWSELTVPVLPAGNNWVFVESGNIDLSSYIGETVNIAFKFMSTTDVAATWEIDWVQLREPGFQILGKDPETLKTVYEYKSSGKWMVSEDVYIVTGPDYNAMGAPGKYDNFSASDLPYDYIPALLSARYPLAGEGSEKVVIYRYYTGVTGVYTITLADRYLFSDGEWHSTYQYVGEMTSQFLFSNGEWVFDPTVVFEMGSADYQLIVDWVETNIGSEMVDSYGTQEFYHAAGSYYSNFDLRPGKWDETVFDSWQDAVTAAIGNALLPSKFPNAVAQVSGIDVYYTVTFATYGGPSGKFSVTFQCTKSGPNPEFTLVTPIAAL
ncbi:MAG: choice-of-anchor J domain-containing protein [Bacteroidales bacterium]|nr:choice-of-anchor J domain-containing protein [Bacteroidales bacterium]